MPAELANMICLRPVGTSELRVLYMSLCCCSDIYLQKHLAVGLGSA